MLVNKTTGRKNAIWLAIIVSLFMANCGFADAQTYSFQIPWGTQGTGEGQFNQPVGIAVDSSGNVYVADSGNHRIQKFNANGALLAKWGTIGSGEGDFYMPLGVAVDLAGNVYVADSGNNRIQRFDSNGKFLAQWSSFNSDSQEYPTGVAADAAGNVYVIGVTSALNVGRLEKYSKGGVLLGVWNTSVLNEEEASKPSAIAADTAGDIYVADSGVGAIKKFTSRGVFVDRWEGDQFKNVDALGVDTVSNLYITASTFSSDGRLLDSSIKRYYGSGDLQSAWGSLGSGEGQFRHPRGLAVDAVGNVYVADTENDRIQKFSVEPQKFGPSPDTALTVVILAVLVGVTVLAYYRFNRLSMKKRGQL